MGGKSREGRKEEKLQRRKEEEEEEEAGVEEEKKKKKRHRFTVRNTEKSLYIYAGRNWLELNDLSFLFSLFQNFFLKSLNWGLCVFFFSLNLGLFWL